MKSLPARYSFTYLKNGDRWLIVDHHSSADAIDLKEDTRRFTFRTGD